MVDPVTEAVCRLPIDFHARDDLSPLQLVRRSGYLTNRATTTVDALYECLANHPDWVDAWFGWSEDNRGSPSWWLASPASATHEVGYVDRSRERPMPPTSFNDRTQACAEFVSHEIDSMAQSVERIDAARIEGESDLDVAFRIAKEDGGQQ